MHTHCQYIIIMLHYRKTGGLQFGPATSKHLKEIIGGFQHYNINYEELSSAEVNEQFLYFNLPPNYKFVIEEDAGILAASRAVDVIQVDNVCSMIRDDIVSLHHMDRSVYITLYTHVVHVIVNSGGGWVG